MTNTLRSKTIIPNLFFDDDKRYSPTFVAVKTADTARSLTTTYTNDPHLIIPVRANRIYSIEGVIWYSGSTIPDLKLRFESETSFGNAQISSTFVADAAHIDLHDDVTLQTTATKVGYHFRGSLATGLMADLFKVQWAQNTSDIDGVTLHANSYMKLLRLA